MDRCLRSGLAAERGSRHGRCPHGRRRFDALRACRCVAAVAPLGRRRFSALIDRACCAAVAPLGRRHASFAQTVLACSETGAAVNLWSLTGTARQLSSQAAELARRGMPRPFSATAAGKQSRNAQPERLRVHEMSCARPERPSGSELRGLRSREGGAVCDHRRRVPAPPSDAGGARAEPGAARASARPGPEVAGGRAKGRPWNRAVARPC